MNSVSATSSRFPTFQQWSPIGAVVGGIFVIDLLIPLGVAAAVLYIAAVLISLRHRKSQLSLGTAIACSTLTIIALFLSPVGGELWKVLMNRALALFAIWTTALMVRYQLQQAEIIEIREKTIQNFIDTMPSACFSFDQQGMILSWNPTAERIYGYSKKEAVGVSYFELMVTPETREDSKNVIAGIFQGKSFQDMIWHDKNKNGEYGWRAGNLFPVFNAQGNVAYGVNFNIDITAQKRAELELQTNNTLLEAILDSATDAIYAKDPEGKYLLFNKTASNVVGKPPEVIIGKDDFEVFGSETAKPLNQFDKKVCSLGKALTLEEKIVTHEGLRVFSTTKSPLIDPAGKTIGLVGVSRDITQQKQIQQDLLLTDRVFRASPDHISIIGRDYRYRRVNPSYKEAFGKTSQEIVGMSVPDLLGEDVFTQTVKPMLDRCFQGEEIHYESWFTFPNEQRHYMDVTYLPLSQENTDIQEIVVISRDFTERKQAEETLQRQALMFNTVYDGVLVTDLDGKITDWNPAAEQMFGYSKEEVLGHTASLMHHPSERATLTQSIIETLSVEGRWQGEIPFLRKDGIEGICETVVAPLNDLNGQSIGTIGVNRDITERKHVEDQFLNIVKGVSSATGENFFRSFVEYLTKALNVDYACVGQIIEKEVPTIGTIAVFGKGNHLDNFEYSLNDTPCENVITHGFSAYPSEVSRRFPKDSLLQELEIQGYAGLPLYDSNEQAMGLIVVLHQEPLIQLKSIESTMKIFAAQAEAEFERTQVAEALKESEQRFRTYFETGLVGMTITSVDKGWLEVNDRLSTMLGYSREELQQKTWAELTFPDDLLSDEVQFNKLLSGTLDSYSIEKRFIRKDDSLIHTNLYVNAVRTPSKQVEYITAMIEDITQRKEGEIRLRNNEVFTNSILENLPNMVFVKDAKTLRFVRINQAAETLLGYQREELLGKNDYDFFPEPEAAFFTSKDRAVLTEGKFIDIPEESIHTKNDGVRILHTKKLPICDSEGIPRFLLGISEDITEKKQTEELLKKWATIFQHTQWGVAVSQGNSSNIAMVNESFARMHDYAIQELEGKPMTMVYAPDFHSQLPKIIEQVHREGFLSFEALRLRKDGSTFPALVTASSIKDLNGQTLYRVANVIDISDHKKAEEAFRQSERLAHSAMNALTAQLCVLDETGQILTTNERWDQFARENNGDPKKLGKGSNYITVCVQSAQNDGKDAKTFLNGLNAVLTRQQEEFSFDYPCSSPEKIRWFSARVTRFPDPGPIRAVVSHYDITERKILEAAIRKQTVNLETEVIRRTNRIQELEQRRMQVEKLAALAQIAAGVAHEINNPLASISQSLVLLKRAIPQEHPHFRYMAKVEDCIERIAQITKHLYQLYRPSGPIPTPIDLRVPLHTAKDIMAERAQKHGIRIRTSSTPDPITASVPQGELTQVLCNLIQNAIEASPPESTIDVSIATGTEVLSILVADQGRGIPREAASHIFEPFYTTKQNHEEGGMGLGLSISHSLIESMGGKLDFSTSIGQGSTFTIKLPPT